VETKHYEYPNVNVETLGRQWFYLSQNATTSDTWTVTLTSSAVSFNFYLSFGESSNPNQFKHDIMFGNIQPGKNFVLSKDIIPDGAFTATV